MASSSKFWKPGDPIYIVRTEAAIHPKEMGYKEKTKENAIGWCEPETQVFLTRKGIRASSNVYLSGLLTNWYRVKIFVVHSATMTEVTDQDELNYFAGK